MLILLLVQYHWWWLQTDIFLQWLQHHHIKYPIIHVRPIIVNFSFIVISCTWSLMQHAVIIWLFGKIFWKFCFLFPVFFHLFLRVLFIYRYTLKQYNSNIFKLHFVWVCLFLSHILKQYLSLLPRLCTPSMTHHPPHHPSSFPKCCRSNSIWDSGGFSYQVKEVETQETQQTPNDVNITWQFWRNLTQNIIKSKKEKIIKPNKNTFPFCFYNTVCFFYPVWQPDPFQGLTFSKPGIQNMFQQALNKNLCLTPSPPIC